MIAYIYLVVFLIGCGMQQITAANSAHYCYSGSSIYELEVQNCPTQNASYTGTWMCGTMRICESFMSSARECIITRGCATEEQCNFDVDTDGALKTSPAGMTIYPSCCTAGDFPTDDTVTLAYKKICNPAAVSFTVPSLLVSMSVAAVIAVVCTAVF